MATQMLRPDKAAMAFGSRLQGPAPAAPAAPVMSQFTRPTQHRVHRRVRAAAASSTRTFPPFMPPVVREIRDEAALDMAAEVGAGERMDARCQMERTRVQAPVSGLPFTSSFPPLQMRRVPVTVPSLGSLPLQTAVVGPTGEALDLMGVAKDAPVLVLLHSFDSSSLE